MKDYMLMYLETSEKEIVYKKVSDRWEVGIAKNDHNNGFTQVSFVNSILTSEGGKHVDYITEQVCILYCTRTVYNVQCTLYMYSHAVFLDRAITNYTHTYILCC